MIHVVTIANQHLYARQLDEMFRMRHEFYVRQRGWTNLTSTDGRETDEFDNDHAVYLMNLDRYGSILATFRLNPTTTPYLLGDKLPEYLEGEAPRSEQIWDLTRWMVAPHARRKANDQIADAQKVLLCGVMEFAVSRGATALTCLMDTVFVDRIAKVWPATPLGPELDFEDGKGRAIAVRLEAGPHVLVSTRQKTGIYDSVLFEIGAEPAGSDAEGEKRRVAIKKESPMSQAELDRVRAAAQHLVQALKNFRKDDVEGSIALIDQFTDMLGGSPDVREHEDA